MDDPTLILMRLLRDNWNPERMPFDAPVVHHTGWYDRDGDVPCVTYTGLDEGSVSGGQTGYYGTDGRTGLGMQLIEGHLNIDFVAGTRSDLEGTRRGGGNVNPKDARHAMKEHGIEIIANNQVSTPFRVLEAGAGRDLEDTDAGPTVFRYQLRPRFTWERTPSPTA